MTDARACRHPVQGAWQYGLLHPQAVTMCHLAFKQIGYGRQAYMGMWPDIQALGHRSSQCVRPHAVKENEGAHHAALAKRSEEHTSELQSLMRISYAVFCLKKKNTRQHHKQKITTHKI